MILGGLPGLVVILVAFCLWHASVALGVRLALAFLGITVVTSWIFEEVGVLTGLIYGPYHYTSALGPWLGSVPILIPLAWFVLVYPTYIVVNLARGGWPVGTPGGRANLVALALLGALFMAAWDLVIDPVLSGPTVEAWVWERGGPWYGVPVHNFLGWMVTAFTIYLLYRSVERRSGRPAPVAPLASGWDNPRTDPHPPVAGAEASEAGQWRCPGPMGSFRGGAAGRSAGRSRPRRTRRVAVRTS